MSTLPPDNKLELAPAESIQFDLFIEKIIQAAESLVKPAHAQEGEALFEELDLSENNPLLSYEEQMLEELKEVMDDEGLLSNGFAHALHRVQLQLKGELSASPITISEQRALLASIQTLANKVNSVHSHKINLSSIDVSDNMHIAKDSGFVKAPISTDASVAIMAPPAIPARIPGGAVAPGNLGGGLQNNAGNQVAGNNVAGNNVAGNNVAGNNVAGNNVAGNNVAGNNVAGNNVAGNNVAGNNVAGNNVAGNNVAGNNVAGNNVAGNNVAGNNVAGNNNPNPTQPGTMQQIADAVNPFNVFNNLLGGDAKKPADTTIDDTAKVDNAAVDALLDDFDLSDNTTDETTTTVESPKVQDEKTNPTSTFTQVADTINPLNFFSNLFGGSTKKPADTTVTKDDTVEVDDLAVDALLNDFNLSDNTTDETTTTVESPKVQDEKTNPTSTFTQVADTINPLNFFSNLFGGGAKKPAEPTVTQDDSVDNAAVDALLDDFDLSDNITDEKVEEEAVDTLLADMDTPVVITTTVEPPKVQDEKTNPTSTFTQVADAINPSNLLNTIFGFGDGAKKPAEPTVTQDDSVDNAAVDALLDDFDLSDNTTEGKMTEEKVDDEAVDTLLADMDTPVVTTTTVEPPKVQDEKTNPTSTFTQVADAINPSNLLNTIFGFGGGAKKPAEPTVTQDDSVDNAAVDALLDDFDLSDNITDEKVEEEAVDTLLADMDTPVVITTTVEPPKVQDEKTNPTSTFTQVADAINPSNLLNTIFGFGDGAKKPAEPTVTQDDSVDNAAVDALLDDFDLSDNTTEGKMTEEKVDDEAVDTLLADMDTPVVTTTTVEPPKVQDEKTNPTSTFTQVADAINPSNLLNTLLGFGGGAKKPAEQTPTVTQGDKVDNLAVDDLLAEFDTPTLTVAEKTDQNKVETSTTIETPKVQTPEIIADATLTDKKDNTVDELQVDDLLAEFDIAPEKPAVEPQTQTKPTDVEVAQPGFLKQAATGFWNWLTTPTQSTPVKETPVVDTTVAQTTETELTVQNLADAVNPLNLLSLVNNAKVDEKQVDDLLADFEASHDTVEPTISTPVKSTFDEATTTPEITELTKPTISVTQVADMSNPLPWLGLTSTPLQNAVSSPENAAKLALGTTAVDTTVEEPLREVKATPSMNALTESVLNIAQGKPSTLRDSSDSVTDETVDELLNALTTESEDDEDLLTASQGSDSSEEEADTFFSDLENDVLFTNEDTNHVNEEQVDDLLSMFDTTASEPTKATVLGEETLTGAPKIPAEVLGTTSSVDHQLIDELLLEMDLDSLTSSSSESSDDLDLSLFETEPKGVVKTTDNVEVLEPVISTQTQQQPEPISVPKSTASSSSSEDLDVTTLFATDTDEKAPVTLTEDKLVIEPVITTTTTQTQVDEEEVDDLLSMFAEEETVTEPKAIATVIETSTKETEVKTPIQAETVTTTVDVQPVISETDSAQTTSNVVHQDQVDDLLAMFGEPVVETSTAPKNVSVLDLTNAAAFDTQQVDNLLDDFSLDQSSDSVDRKAVDGLLEGITFDNLHQSEEIQFQVDDDTVDDLLDGFDLNLEPTTEVTAAKLTSSAPLQTSDVVTGMQDDLVDELLADFNLAETPRIPSTLSPVEALMTQGAPLVSGEMKVAQSTLRAATERFELANATKLLVEEQLHRADIRKEAAQETLEETKTYAQTFNGATELKDIAKYFDFTVPANAQDDSAQGHAWANQNAIAAHKALDTRAVAISKPLFLAEDHKKLHTVDDVKDKLASSIPVLEQGLIKLHKEFTPLEAKYEENKKTLWWGEMRASYPDGYLATKRCIERDEAKLAKYKTAQAEIEALEKAANAWDQLTDAFNNHAQAEQQYNTCLQRYNVAEGEVESARSSFASAQSEVERLQTTTHHAVDTGHDHTQTLVAPVNEDHSQQIQQHTEFH
uniref:Uncharacterized protein n=1 Tax=Candidatus Berkiella aquae TaxID=295108 RepID=A0A0Q9YN63_9GAMM